MAKFKVGDRVRCVSNESDGKTGQRYLVGDCGTVLDESDVPDIWWDNGQRCPADEDELVYEHTPTEHPALTLAKAEVVRLMSQEVFETLGGYSHGRLGAMQEVLSAFGLRYSPKPVVPQPVEYEFVSIEPLRQES